MSTCKDCIHYEICEIMSDQYGISKVPSCQCGFYKNAADVVEVRHGEWIEQIRDYGKYLVTEGVKCSLCGFELTDNDYNYCPNCGADMRGKNNGQE